MGRTIRSVLPGGGARLSAGRLPLARARNAGAHAARLGHLVFLDVDCIPRRNLLSVLDAELRAWMGSSVPRCVTWDRRPWEMTGTRSPSSKQGDRTRCDVFRRVGCGARAILGCSGRWHLAFDGGPFKAWVGSTSPSRVMGRRIPISAFVPMPLASICASSVEPGLPSIPRGIQPAVAAFRRHRAQCAPLPCEMAHVADAGLARGLQRREADRMRCAVDHHPAPAGRRRFRGGALRSVFLRPPSAGCRRFGGRLH